MMGPAVLKTLPKTLLSLAVKLPYVPHWGSPLKSAPLKVCEDDWILTKLFQSPQEDDCERFRADLTTTYMRADQVRTLLMCTPRNEMQLTPFPPQLH